MGRVEARSWVGGQGLAKGREQACKGGRAGLRGSERGMDLVPTLLITVSLETERGLPLALGNLLGLVTEREQRWREGRGQRRARREGRKEG